LRYHLPRTAVLFFFVALATSCAMIPTASEREAALREPVWNVEPLDPAEWLADRPANAAAWDARYERKVIRFRGRVDSAAQDQDILSQRTSWTVFIRSERANAPLPLLACSVATRELAAMFPAGIPVLVHGVPYELAPGVSYGLRACEFEATGASVPATVKPGKVAVSSGFREEISLTIGQLDAQLAGKDEAAKKRLMEHPLLFTGRVHSFSTDGSVRFEGTNPLRSITCEDLPRDLLALGHDYSVRARVRYSNFMGHVLWGCALLR
jgi:hypothetical protein